MTNYRQLKTAAKGYIERLILPSDPLQPMWNRENFIFRKAAKWNYIDSCMIRSVLMLHELTGDERLLDYAKRFTSAYVTDSGEIPTMNPEDFNLDNIAGGRNLLWLYRLTGEEKFLSGAHMLYNEQLLRQPRLNCGSYWHKAIYPNQLWLDGAYMALPFLADYGIFTGDNSLVDDALHQAENIRNIMQDKASGLYYHGYDETRSLIWADSKTGLSANFWLRSMGWLCAGLVELYELTDDSAVGDMLQELLRSLAQRQQPRGMLLQLPALPHLPENYPETSGTLLFSYAALKACRLGICDDTLKNAGMSALSAAGDFITMNPDGFPVLRNVCLMGGLGGGQNRDGSADYYLSEKIVENDAKGIAPFLMAYTEMLRSEDAQIANTRFVKYE